MTDGHRNRDDVTILLAPSTWRLHSDRGIAASQLLTCLMGLVLPVIPLVSPQAVVPTVFAIALTAVVCLALGTEAKSAIVTTLGAPAWLILLPLLAYVSLQAFRTSAHESWQESLQRPLLLLAFAVTLLHVTTARDRAAPLLGPTFTAGVILGTAVVVVLTVYHFVLARLGLHALAKDVREINRHLEMLSVLIWLVPATRIAGAGPIALAIGSVLFLATTFVLGRWTATDRITHVTSDTVQLGMPLALIVFVAARRWPAKMTTVIFAGLAFVLISAPALYRVLFSVGPHVLPATRRELLLDRMEIWDGVARRIFDRDSFETVFGGGLNALRLDGRFTMEGRYACCTPDHPHNAMLQIWLDAGLIGVGFLLFAIACLYGVVRRATDTEKPAFLAAITMMTLVASVGHSVWQLWFLAFNLTAIALIVVFSRGTTRHDDGSTATTTRR